MKNSDSKIRPQLLDVIILPHLSCIFVAGCFLFLWPIDQSLLFTGLFTGEIRQCIWVIGKVQWEVQLCFIVHKTTTPLPMASGARLENPTARQEWVASNPKTKPPTCGAIRSFCPMRKAVSQNLHHWQQSLL